MVRERTSDDRELCFRCGAAMNWLHQTWQCPRCRLKLGCCEGDGGRVPRVGLAEGRDRCETR